MPDIECGNVSNVSGRSVSLTGSLLSTGASSCVVNLYYGLADQNQSKSNWSFSKV